MWLTLLLIIKNNSIKKMGFVAQIIALFTMVSDFFNHENWGFDCNSMPVRLAVTEFIYATTPKKW